MWHPHIQTPTETWPIPHFHQMLILITSTHILGGYRINSKFRSQPHNNTFTLLHQLLRKSDGGRWPILGVDFRQKPFTDFKNIAPIINDPIQPELQAIPHPSQEGLQDDNLNITTHTQAIPDYILYPQQRSQHHRRCLVRAVRYSITQRDTSSRTSHTEERG